MARAISDEELQLKRRARRRLIGAVVLVTAIIVVLPMLLDSEPKPAGQEVKVQIPSPDSGIFTSKAVPLPAAPESKAAPKAPEPAPAAKPPVEDAKKPVQGSVPDYAVCPSDPGESGHFGRRSQPRGSSKSLLR